MSRRLGWGWLGAFAAALAVVALAAAPSRAADEGSSRTWLGVYSQSLSAGLRDGLDYDGEGVLVNRVVPDSPASRAGLQKGDVIVSLNSRKVRSPEDLANLVQDGSPGQSVSLDIVRDGSRRTLTAKLGSADESTTRRIVIRDRDRDNDRDGDQGDDEDSGPMFEAPVPPVAPDAPDAPRAPRTPRTPRVFSFEGNPGDFLNNWSNLAPGRGRLGVRVEALNPDLANALGVSDAKGTLVLEVLKGTPAERAGLKAGDVITAVGSRPVFDSGDLVDALRGIDDNVTLSVTRRGARRSVEARLDPAPSAMRWNSNNGQMGDRIKIRQRLNDSDAKDNGELRDELRQLRDEVQRLRDQMHDMHRN